MWHDCDASRLELGRVGRKILDDSGRPGGAWGLDGLQCVLRVGNRAHTHAVGCKDPTGGSSVMEESGGQI